MIQTKEEFFLAEMGINSQATIEGDYNATYKLKDLLKQYTEQCNIHEVIGLSEHLVCSCGSIKVQTTGGSQCPNNRCSSAN